MTFAVFTENELHYERVAKPKTKQMVREENI